MEQRKVSFVSALGTVNLNLLISCYLLSTFKYLSSQTKMNIAIVPTEVFQAAFVQYKVGTQL